MNKKIIFMFSGQGSQYYQMGKELYEKHSRFKFWMDRCDGIVLPLIQTSLIDLIYHRHSKGESFDRLFFSNPALLSIEYSLASVLMEMGVQPDYLLGYSLGELSACIVSGILSLESGIQIGVNLARLMEAKTQYAEMLAIIESFKIIEEFPELFDNCWLTGKNFNNNFVVSGLTGDINKLKNGLIQKNITFQKLPVKYGFHTKIIDSVEEEFKRLFQNVKTSSFDIPIISSLKTELLNEVNADYLWDVIRFPVNFEKTINNTLQKEDSIFIDVGPSGTLATFVKYLLPPDSNSISIQMINQYGRDMDSIKRLFDCLTTVTSDPLSSGICFS